MPTLLLLKDMDIHTPTGSQHSLVLMYIEKWMDRCITGKWMDGWIII